MLSERETWQTIAMWAEDRARRADVAADLADDAMVRSLQEEISATVREWVADFYSEDPRGPQ